MVFVRGIPNLGRSNGTNSGSPSFIKKGILLSEKDIIDLQRKLLNARPLNKS